LLYSLAFYADADAAATIDVSLLMLMLPRFRLCRFFIAACFLIRHGIAIFPPHHTLLIAARYMPRRYAAAMPRAVMHAMTRRTE